MKKLLIAIIDDDPQELESLVSAFNENIDFIELKIFSNGEDFFLFLNLSLQLPTILITDFYMPKMSGRDLILKLKSNPRTKTIPIGILSTTVRNPEIISFSAKEGVYLFQKPQCLMDYALLANEIFLLCS